MTLSQQAAVSIFALAVVLAWIWLVDPADAEPDRQTTITAAAPPLVYGGGLLIEHTAPDGELLELSVAPGWSVSDIVDTIGEIETL